MGLIFGEFFTLNQNNTKSISYIFLMLMPQIIGVLSLYHCTHQYPPSIYANIKNITFFISN